MPKFAANLTMLFTELEVLDRFDAAARAGFTAVEYLFPYDHPPEALNARLRANGLQLVLHNLPPGDWEAGERGLACLPDRVDAFRESVHVARDHATALGCPQVNCLAGRVPGGLDPGLAERTLIENLRYASEVLGVAGIKVLLEPINRFDIPGYAVNTSAQALRIIDAVGSENLFLQYDIYHMQRMEGELANTIAANLARIAHMQLADTPGRHEPGTGEINYPFLFDLIDRLGYDGWIGCEYIPATGTGAGFGWLNPYLG